jgi:ketosteroid isomerase-like protein
MSRENVEAVRRWIDAYNRRDFDELIELTDPDFEFRSRFVAMESVFRGYDGFPYAYFETLDDAYEQFVVVPREVIDAGAAVLMIGHAEWCGKASGARGKTPMRGETFTEGTEALDAVGLSE